MVKSAYDLRRAHANEELTTVLTTRRLLALCARLERGNGFPRALQVCVLNKVPQEDVHVIRETFEHHVGRTRHNKSKRFAFSTTRTTRSHARYSAMRMTSVASYPRTMLIRSLRTTHVNRSTLSAETAAQGSEV